MVKLQTAFRLHKDTLEYLDSETNKGKFKNRTQALTFMINYYKQEQGFILELPNKFNNLLMTFYNSFIPFTFACLFAWFFFSNKWIFFPALIVAIFPFIFKLELKDNAVKVSI